MKLKIDNFWDSTEFFDKFEFLVSYGIVQNRFSVAHRYCRTSRLHLKKKGTLQHLYEVPKLTLKFYLKKTNEISDDQVKFLIEKFVDANAYMQIALELKARSHDDLASKFAILAFETPGILKGQEFNDLAACVNHSTKIYKNFCTNLFNNFPTLETWILFRSEKKSKLTLTKSISFIPDTIPLLWEYRNQIAKKKKKIENFFDSFNEKDLIIEKIIEILMKSETEVKEWIEMFSDLLIRYFKEFAFSLLSKADYFVMNQFPDIHFNKLMDFKSNEQDYHDFKIRLIKIAAKDFSNKISASKPDYAKLSHWLLLMKIHFKSNQEWKQFVEKFIQRTSISKRKLLVVAIQGMLEKQNKFEE
jgi:hypothetical protein